MGTGAYYGLTADPFDKHFNRPDNCFQSDDFRQVASRLGHLKDVRGIGVFTATPGMGKSLAMKCFVEGLNPNLYSVSYIAMSTLSVGEFYRQLCSELGITGVYGKSAMVKAVKDQVRYMYSDKRQTYILVIDEAQYLAPAVLTDLKMLMNFDYDTLNCFALVLCGEPYLMSILDRPFHTALKQRITVHYEYHGLLDGEVREYVLHKIRAAGGAESIIDPAALSALHGYSQGNPRIIDNLMSDALLLGEQMKKNTLDADVVTAAAVNRMI